MQTTKILTSLVIVLFASSCSSSKQLIEAKELIESHKYPEAIELLKSSSGSSAKKLLAEAYLNYGISLIREQEGVERYALAKEQLEQAVKADPNNKAARDLYQMVIKMQVLKS